MNNHRRPANFEVPLLLAKELQEKVWQKFQMNNPKTQFLRITEQLNLLHKETGVGPSVLRKLKKEAGRRPEPPFIKLSRETVERLCSFIGDAELPVQIFMDPDMRALMAYFGEYLIYWRGKKGGATSLFHSELVLSADSIVLSGDTGRATGGRMMLKNANLFFSVEQESKKSNFIFNVGAADEERLSFIPGLCLTLNSDVAPVCMAVLLARADKPVETDQALLERYFDKFQGREFVWGVKASWFSSLQPYRISGLFGNWYIYHAHNGIMRRGKIRIEGERHLTYTGTLHTFRQGHVEIFNNTNISITLRNDSKILHLLGRIGDQTDIRSRTHIRCIFSSTGKGGSTLKAGVSLMIRETETPFAEMAPAVIVSEDRSKYLSAADLELISDIPEDIEI